MTLNHEIEASDDSDQATDICQVSEEEELLRSGHLWTPIEKMLAFQREEAHKKGLSTFMNNGKLATPERS